MKDSLLALGVALLCSAPALLGARETYLSHTDNATFASDYNKPGQWIYADLNAVAAVKFLSDPAPAPWDAVPSVLALDDATNQIEWSFYDAPSGSYGFKGFSHGFNSPGGIVATSNGDVFVSDSFNHQIVKLNYNANNMSFVANFGGPGKGEGQFNTPMEIAVDSNGLLYVADFGNGRVQKLTKQGVPADSFTVRDRFNPPHASNCLGSFGSANGQFLSPIGVTVNLSNNFIYVADVVGRVQEFDPSGHFQNIVVPGSPGVPSNARISYLESDLQGQIYGVDRVNNAVYVFDSNLSFLYAFSGSILGPFSKLHALAIDKSQDSSGNWYSRYNLWTTEPQRLTQFTVGISVDYVVGQNCTLLNSSSGGQSSFNYGLSEQGSVVIKVFSEGTQSFVRSYPATSALAGNNTGSWDGRDDGGHLVPEGMYDIVVIATDVLGASSHNSTQTSLSYCGEKLVASNGFPGIGLFAGAMAQHGSILYHADPNGYEALNMVDGQVLSWNPNSFADSSTFGRALIGGGIQCMTVSEDGSTVYVGGEFGTGVGGVARHGLAAFDAKTGQLLNWNPDLENGSSSVIAMCIVESKGVVYVGGTFSAVNGSIPRKGMAAFDATTGVATGFDPQFDDGIGTVSVRHISVDAGRGVVYAGGSFTSARGFTRKQYAALSASSGIPTSWNTGLNPNLGDLDGSIQVVADGVFISNAPTGASGISKVSLSPNDTASSSSAAPTITVLPWRGSLGNQGFEGDVFSFYYDGCVLYVGGEFGLADGQLRTQFAAFDPTGTGSLLPWNPFDSTALNALFLSTPGAQEGAVEVASFGCVTYLQGLVTNLNGILEMGLFRYVNCVSDCGAETISLVPTATAVPSATPVRSSTPTNAVTPSASATSSPSGTCTGTATESETASPAFTASSTSTQSPTPTPNACANVSLQYKANITLSSTNTLGPWIRLANSGSNPVNLSDLSIRYWFVNDGGGSLVGNVDSAGIQPLGTVLAANQVPLLFESSGLGGQTNDLLISFAPGSGALAPGSYVEVQLRISKTDWSNFNQNEDYSFNPAATAFSSWDRIAAYCQGGIIWGTPPSGIQATTPSPSPTFSASATPNTGAGCGIQIKYMTNSNADSWNSPAPMIQVYNASGSSINLANVSARYWYTEEGTQPQTVVVDWAGRQPSGADITASTLASIVPTSQGGQTHYVQIAFASGAGTLAPGDYAEVHFRINKSDWTNYSQGNDYSFGANLASFSSSTAITGYCGGSLAWGVEPFGSALTNTFTSTGTPTPSNTSTTVITPSLTPSFTDTKTVSPTFSITLTPSLSPTHTPTSSTSPTFSASPTFTQTAVPTATATQVVTGGCNLKVQYETSANQASTNSIAPQLMIVCTNPGGFILSPITARYWFTEEGSTVQSVTIDWAGKHPSGANITSSTHAFFHPTSQGGQNSYLEVSFDTGAGSIGFGESVEIHLRFNKTDWSNYTQTNDYSFSAAAANFIDWPKTTGYCSGILSWGTPP